MMTGALMLALVAVPSGATGNAEAGADVPGIHYAAPSECSDKYTYPDIPGDQYTARYFGYVNLRLSISATGVVDHAVVVSATGDPRLVPATLAAVRGFKVAPARCGSAPVASVAPFSVRLQRTQHN
jgi:TonB family protein